MGEIEAVCAARVSLPAQPSPDDLLVRLWLHGRPVSTSTAYRREVDRLRSRTGKTLADLTLEDLQGFVDGLGGAPASARRSIAAVKSLLSFGARIGALRLNVGAALRSPAVRDGLSNRILSVREARRILRAPSSARDRAMVALFYEGGFRSAELRGIRWCDVAEATDGGSYVTVFGKGGKTRTVRLSRETTSLVTALRGADVESEGNVFVGRCGALDPSQIWRIVKAATRVAGVEKPVSPHWLRHAHASHAIEKGAPLALVRDTLGHASVATTDRYLHSRPHESSGRYLR